MEDIIQELNLIEINCEIVKEFIFGNIYGLKFCIIQYTDSKIIKYFIDNNIIPILLTNEFNNYEFHNLITNKKVLWKSTYKTIKKHLSSCECILCQEKIKIKNNIFYNIAESLIM
jgi:hypothetical protein